MDDNVKQAMRHSDYTVGWLCALPTEMAAAKAMLDEVHPSLAEQDPQDHNSYCLGRIARHNIVIASLPAGWYGETPAATVAKDMLRTFKSIRFGLLVGIGGAVPSASHDIRLGDVVISQPTARHGGVIQYDRGKVSQGGRFQQTGVLNSPPVVLLTALSRLQADHDTGDSQVPRYLSRMFEERPKMLGKYGHQGIHNDCLFHADYEHHDLAADCSQCDRGRAVERQRRIDIDPVFHYGTIASGNCVIKDGTTRDELRKEHDVLCFEMEAAGIMQEFPCLVIRGICDYADSHKNKAWQGYAAATASAFAKELLSLVLPATVLHQPPVAQLVTDPILHKEVANTNAIITEHAQRYQAQQLNEKQTECLRAFNRSDYRKFKNINPDRVLGTCQWVLRHPQYTTWLQDNKDSLLWISADPGCGKSVLAKYLVDHALQSESKLSVCHFFFKDNIDQDSASAAICALLHQLLSQQPLLISHAMKHYEKDGDRLTSQLESLWSILLASAKDENASSILCVLDALDECNEHNRVRLIRLLSSFYTSRTTNSTRQAQLKFLVTSRPYQHIEFHFRDIPPDLPSIRLAGEEKNAEISEEINLVVKQRVADVSDKFDLSHECRYALETKLLGITNRTYLWLHLVIEDMFRPGSKRTKAALLQRITELPATVEDAYERILQRAGSTQRGNAMTLLHIIVGARRPLHLEEMDVAFHLATTVPDARSYGDLDLDGVEGLKSRIREICGLFIFIRDEYIYLIHQTAKEFLVEHDTNTEPNSTLWKHCLQPDCTESLMARISIQYLFLADTDEEGYHDLFKFDQQESNTVDEEESGSNKAVHNFGAEESDSEMDMDSDKSSFRNHAVHPFLRYSASYWADHFREMKMDDDELTNLAYELYNENRCLLRSWARRRLASQGGWPEWRDRPLWIWLSGWQKIHFAAVTGHDKIISRLLVKHQLCVDAYDESGKTALQYACYNGHILVAQLLLDNGADPNLQCHSGTTALHLATWQDNDVMVELLLNRGAHVDLAADVFGTALVVAAHRGNERCFQLLLDRGADVHAQRAFSQKFYKLTNAFETACNNGHEGIVKILLRHDQKASTQEITRCFRLACRHGHDAVARTLLDHGAEVDAEDIDRTIALQMACMNGYASVVRILLDHGADVNRQSSGGGMTALQYAAYRGRETIVYMLVSNGADVNARCQVPKWAVWFSGSLRYNFFGTSSQTETALTIACRQASHQGYDRIIQALIDGGAEINAEGGREGSALAVAAHKGYLRTMQVLLKNGADVNMRLNGFCYDNGLTNNILRRYPEAARNIELVGIPPCTALHLACAEGNLTTVRLLLDHGADVHAQGGIFGSAIHTACYKGDRKMVQMLISYGADINAPGSGYESPIQAAWSQASHGTGHFAIVLLLRSEGAVVPWSEEEIREKMWIKSLHL